MYQNILLDLVSSNSFVSTKHFEHGQWLDSSIHTHDSHRSLSSVKCWLISSEITLGCRSLAPSWPCFSLLQVKQIHGMSLISPGIPAASPLLHQVFIGLHHLTQSKGHCLCHVRKYFSNNQTWVKSIISVLISPSQECYCRVDTNKYLTSKINLMQRLCQLLDHPWDRR